MTRRPLGRTGFHASVVGLGDLADRAVPLETCVATLRRALDFGLNLVDTAPGYEDGYSEQIVGAALKGGRDGVFVIDKIDHLDQPVGPQVDLSLVTLGTEVVDLFVFHAVSEVPRWNRIAEVAMAEPARCQAAGKVRFRGISSHNPEVLRAALASGLCDVVMFPVGPFVDRRYVDEILPLARQQGVGTVCFKTFGAGKLLGDTTGYNQPLQSRPRGKFSSGGQTPAEEPQLPRLSVADCLHYTLTLDPDVALLGMSFPNEQDAVLQALRRFQPLSKEQMDDIGRRAEEAVEGKGVCWWNGLRALHVPDQFAIPQVADGYSALFWMDYRDAYVPGRDADDRANYPYLGWACDHFHGQRRSPISDRDYPLTWEAEASQARYQGMALVSEEFVKRKLAAPHTWHAAEVFLYLLEAKRN